MTWVTHTVSNPCRESQDTTQAFDSLLFITSLNLDEYKCYVSPREVMKGQVSNYVE